MTILILAGHRVPFLPMRVRALANDNAPREDWQ